ncbi:hypothetical protein RUND412_006099 [Rhizina undulata]
MALPPTLGDRNIDQMRYRSIHPFAEAKFPAYTPLHPNGEPSPLSAASDARATLQRRFTLDSKPQAPMSLNPTGFPRMTVSDSLDLAPGAHQKYLLLKQKEREYQLRHEQQKLYQAHMEMIEMQQRKDAQDILRMAQDLDRSGIGMDNHGYRNKPSTGRNEPKTPPDLRDSPFGLSKTGLASAALATPPAVAARIQTQQLMTPPADDILLLSQKNSKSLPASRRNSDEDNNAVPPEQVPVKQRVGVRTSLPNGAIARPAVQNSESGSILGLEQQLNTTKFLFDDEVDKSASTKHHQATASPDVKTYLQMTDTEDQFPILVRRESYPGRLSVSSAALDLAFSHKEIAQPQKETPQENGWPALSRHRPAQHSLPLINYPYTPTSNASPKVTVPQTDSPIAARRYDRSSVDLSFGHLSENLHAKLAQTEVASHGNQTTMPKLQPSFSTSDLPTIRNANNMSNLARANVNVDRTRNNREPSSNGDASHLAGTFGTYKFGPPLHANAGTVQIPTPPGVSPLPSPGLYGAYGQFNLPNAVFHAAPFGPYPLYNGSAKVADVSHQGQNFQSRNVPKRNHDGEANRFANISLESLVNDIYDLCKDQHGCRYLQKKLEERNPQYVQIIFRETQAHVVELMTDPFGNYLCQKLLEYANDEQRTILVNNAAPQLVKIALNQHGTRALQKMIDYLSTREQIETIVKALKSKVVELIQDLNGNHVIQKCLNRLKSENAQFVFDAVGEQCVLVGTHRHGCCVLQRCIDHASGSQKIQLIQKITANAIHLVQDQFGNYVVQYILDLGEATLSEPLIHKFRGRVCELSKQKFSSNVIEKCLRVAELSTKKLLVEEMLNPEELEKLLRDSYANYVIQTAMDYADPATRQKLIDSIKPMLPLVRMSPHGRRIQSKIHAATTTTTQTGMPFQTGGASNGPAPSRANSYPQAQVRPNPVQQPYHSPYRTDMTNQYYM